MPQHHGEVEPALQRAKVDLQPGHFARVTVVAAKAGQCHAVFAPEDALKVTEAVEPSSLGDFPHRPISFNKHLPSEDETCPLDFFAHRPPQYLLESHLKCPP